MEYKDSFELLISGLQHFSFCRRQWALIHIEQQWEENYFTVDGKLMHDKADNPYFTEKRGELLVSRAMPVRSARLGVTGTCDVVEFHADSNGVEIAGRDGLWKPIPVEYKRGKSKTNDADRLQLCAQAICLEEMLGCERIDTAYLYYGETRRREVVALDKTLREEVEMLLTEMRELYRRGHTPKSKPSARCRSCSLHDVCLPKLQKQRSTKSYLQSMWEGSDEEG